MNSNIKININYSESDIKKAIHFYLLNIYNLKKYAFVVYPILTASVVLSITFNYYFLGVIYVVCGFILRQIYYTKPMERYIKVYKIRKGGLFILNEDQMEMFGDEIQSTIQWSLYKKAYEIPSAFLLMDSNKFIYVFPKSCFIDDSLIEQMRHLLSMKFSDYKKYD